MPITTFRINPSLTRFAEDTISLGVCFNLCPENIDIWQTTISGVDIRKDMIGV